MPEIIADNIAIVDSDKLEETTRLDAEYYHPEYLNIENKLLNTANYRLWKDINGKFITGPFGSAFNVENYVSNTAYRFIRGKDVKAFFLLDDDNVYIPEKDFERLKKYALLKGDILISVVGTLGNAVIVDKNNTPAVFSCKSTAFRAEALNPFFLIAYLNCQFGKELLQRKVRGAVQTGLNIDDLRSLPIYLPNTEFQNKIANLVINAKNNFEKSKLLYSQAESLLLSELGIKDIDLSHEPCYEVTSADTISANRIDAEYYQPKYERVIEAIKKHSYKSIGDMFRLAKGIEPGSSVYCEQGKAFIRVSNLNNFEINNNNQQYLSEKTYSELKENYQPLQGEILLSKDATPGIAYHLKEPVEGIISGGILRLQALSNIKKEYICLVINSLVGQSQIERDAGGSLINHWKPSQVRNTLIPMLTEKIQKKMEFLCIESHTVRQQAKVLLEEAKRKVEDMIEKGQG
jgi:restriction endonuclease S subunit